MPTHHEMKSARNLILNYLLNQMAVKIDKEDVQWLRTTLDAIDYALGSKTNTLCATNIANLRNAARMSGSTIRVFLEHEYTLDIDGVKIKVEPEAIMPPPANWLCQTCGGIHAPEHEHNLHTVYYQVQFLRQHGREPKPEDACAHCTPEYQAGFLKAYAAWKSLVEQPQPIANEEKQCS